VCYPAAIYGAAEVEAKKAARMTYYLVKIRHWRRRVHRESICPAYRRVRSVGVEQAA
jgi:hypothetical protein